MSTTFLKKYKVIQRIGEGSFSEVLKCQDRITGQFYAGKRLKRIYQTTNEILESSELIAMRKISQHPNILHMFEFHHDPLPGRVTLIFELMDMSLYDMIKARKNRVMTEQRVKMYFYQLLQGLDHLHKHGIFHRDIKPENILIKAELVKLADLGSVRGIFSKPPYTEYISTRWYRSPECLLTTGFYGPKMDIWALGCVFYELLTLKPLFPGSNEIDQITQIHTILGTPHARLVAKFRRHQSTNCDFNFPIKGGTGFTNLLPHVTETGKELLKLMLVYDPENRSNVKRLLEHRYFRDLKNNDIPRQSSSFTLPSITTDSSSQWRNPGRFNYMMMTTEKHRRCKPLSTRRSMIVNESTSNAPRVVASNPNARPNFSSKSSTSKITTTVGDENNTTTKVLIHETMQKLEKSWRRKVSTTKLERVNASVRSTVSFSTRLPLMKFSGTEISEDAGDASRREMPSKMIQSSFHSQYNLRDNNFYSNFRQKLHEKRVHNNDHKFTFPPEIIQKSQRHRPSISTVSVGSVSYQGGGSKRKTKLATITEAQTALPHPSSSNMKSPTKKKAKHETASNYLGEITPTKRILPKRRCNDRL